MRDLAHAQSAGSPWFDTVAAPRFAVPILLATGAALYVVNLGGYPFYTKGEPREAVTIFDICHGGGWILPMRAGVEIPSKPLMMHWLAALLSLATGGVNEWTVRLPSAALAIGGMLICYFCVRRLFDQRSALLSALMLGTSFQYLQAGTGARVDTTLTFFMEAAFFEFILIAETPSRRWMSLYLAIAGAVLTKGPVGLALPAMVAFAWIVIERRWEAIGRLHIPAGAAIVVVVGGGWYFAATYVGGVDFLRKQIIAENLVRFAGGSEFNPGHAHPFYYLELALIVGFMPWTLLGPTSAIRLRGRRNRLDARVRYLLVWVFIVLIFYSFARSKRGVYLLALYPALTSLVALSVADAVAAPGARPRWLSILSIGAGILTASLAIGAVSAVAMLNLRLEQLARGFAQVGISAPGFAPALKSSVDLHWLMAGSVMFAMAGIAVCLIGARPAIETTIVLIASGVACVTLAANLFIVPAIANTLAINTFTADAMRIVDSRGVAYLGGLNYGVAFYSGRTIPIVQFDRRIWPDYLLSWRDTYERMDSMARSNLEMVLASGPTELDGAGGMVLLQNHHR